ncbi:MAG: UDP-N-acetylmuramoyl-tripeptide--D-alanyl-D-alanine ligase [Alphaproteobacteria bacterium]|nr:UDP-N-acetylmuramoyl-tripeptide--D-alanyl-D-alanine ligase [Alphaproteobacteria bacterium]
MILRAEDLAAGTGGELVAPGPPGHVGTDSRRLGPGQWFLALSGDRFDGHDFLPHARSAGCAGAIGQRVPADWDRGFIRVDDGLTALQALAGWVRDGFPGPVVGITGSAGKTTTRAMTALVMGQDDPDGLRVHCTQGNLNNHIGVPLTILDAPVEADAWVLEMGMSGFGEIDLLQRIGKPTVRLITNVGPAHLDGVGDLDGVKRAKGELFAGARPGDVCVVNADDPRVASIPVPDGVRVVRYGAIHDPSRPVDVRLTDALVAPDTLETRFRIETPGDGVVLGRLASPGLHLAQNACAAVAVGVALHIDPARMAARLARYEPVGMRQRIEDGPDGLRFVNDAYNANPISMAASLRTLAAVQGARRVALLGDMLELGATEAQAHQETLALALDLGIDLVGLAGPRFTAAAQALGHAQDPRLLLSPSSEDLGALVAPRLQTGDVVLAKGSRGLAMERALQSIRAARSPAA